MYKAILIIAVIISSLILLSGCSSGSYFAEKFAKSIPFPTNQVKNACLCNDEAPESTKENEIEVEKEIVSNIIALPLMVMGKLDTVLIVERFYFYKKGKANLIKVVVEPLLEFSLTTKDSKEQIDFMQKNNLDVNTLFTAGIKMQNSASVDTVSLIFHYKKPFLFLEDKFYIVDAPTGVEITERNIEKYVLPYLKYFKSKQCKELKDFLIQLCSKGRVKNNGKDLLELLMEKNIFELVFIPI